MEETREENNDKFGIDQVGTMRLYTDYEWISDYFFDTYTRLKETQLNRQPINFASTQLQHRAMLVHLCSLITRWFSFGSKVLHLSVYYLDRIMDVHCIQPDKLQLIAITCVRVAAEMQHRQVPHYDELNYITANIYSSFEYRAVNRKLLSYFEFQLLPPTTLGFIELLADRFLTNADYVAYIRLWHNNSRGNAHKYPRYAGYEQMLTILAVLLPPMADHSLSFHEYSNEPPSLLAAACVAAVRLVGGVPDMWTPYLCDLTSYTEPMVAPYVQKLTAYSFNENAEDCVARSLSFDDSFC